MLANVSNSQGPGEVVSPVASVMDIKHMIDSNTVLAIHVLVLR